MDNKAKYIDAQKTDHKIQNRKRGEILYYSIEQVADLLNESISNIKYYTNIFDDLLKIEIVDKELHYTNNDVDKLEFLIKLKNRDMSIKEIEDYYSKLPLDDTEIHHTENNLLSVEELIDSIKSEQQIQFNNFKTDLINETQSANLLYLKNISTTIIESQNESLNDFKQNLLKEIKNYIDYKFKNINEANIDLHRELTTNITEFVSKEISSKHDKLKLILQKDFNTFAQSSLTNNERLIKEIKDFKKVIEGAYYTQYEAETDNANEGFLYKLFQLIKLK